MNRLTVKHAQLVQEMKEREVIEAVLRRNEQRYRALVEATTQLIWIWNPKTIIQEDENMKRWWHKLTGQPFEAQQNMGWLEMVHPQDRDKIRASWETALAESTPYDVEYRVKALNDGYRYLSLHAVPLWDMQGVVSEWIGTMQDITDQKAAFEAQAFLASIVESSEDAIVSKSLDGIITFWNVSAERLFGYSAEEAIGQPISIIIPEEKMMEEKNILTQLRQGKRVEHYETVRRSKTGQDLDLSLTISPIYDQSGRIIGASKIARNIGEQKRAREELRQRTRDLEIARKTAEEASRAKSEFLANMSHEIRTPMNSVIGTTELLLHTSLTSEQNEYVHAIYQGGELLLSLINDVLDFSKIEAGEMVLTPGPFHIAKLIEEVVHIFTGYARQNNTALAIENIDDLPYPIMGDCKRLRQIIFNLVGNAVKFTKEGAVCINVRKKMEEAAGVMLIISVSDTGIGIPEDKITSIFEKFIQADSFTTKKYGGTGLGLAISKQLTELMGGEIFVESTPGKGSTFWVEIPFAYAVNEKGETLPVEGGYPGNAEFMPEIQPLTHAKILLVEDYYPNQRVARTMLEKMGCEVEVADDGEEALHKLKEGHYKVVFMDCQMPEMDGFEATRLIREDQELKENIVIAMTANALEGDRERCLAAGMNDYISKPIRSAELQRILKKYAA